MAAQLWELITSREIQDGLYGPLSATLHFGIRGVADEDEARSLLASSIDLTFKGLYFQESRLTPHTDHIFEASVSYGRRFPESFSIDTGTEKVKKMTSISTVSTTAAAGFTAIDFKRSMNVRQNSGKTEVEGVDVGTPTGAFTKTIMLPSPLNATYIQRLFDRAWHMNSDVVEILIDQSTSSTTGTVLSQSGGTLTLLSVAGLVVGQTLQVTWIGGTGLYAITNIASLVVTVTRLTGTTLPADSTAISVAVAVKLVFAVGELLYEQATLNRRGADDWELVLRGNRSPNATALVVSADITVASKKGWDYLWVYFREESDTTAKTMRSVAKQATVEKVYADAELDAIFNPSL